MNKSLHVLCLCLLFLGCQTSSQAQRLTESSVAKVTPEAKKEEGVDIVIRASSEGLALPAAQDFLFAHMKAFEACFIQALRSTQGGPIAAPVELKVSGKGRSTSIKWATTQPAEGRFRRCLKDQILRLQWPKDLAKKGLNIVWSSMNGASTQKASLPYKIHWRNSAEGAKIYQ